MRSSLWMLLLVVLAGMSMVISAGRLAGAKRDRDAAAAQLIEVQRQAQEVIDLRAASQRVNVRERPAQDVIAMVNATMAEAGISTSHFKGLNPEADVAVAAQGSRAQGYRKQSLRLTLEGLSVADIGRFLTAWRQSQQIWTATRLELLHQRNSNSQAYDVTIVFTATYLAEASGSSSAPKLSS